MPAFGSKFLRAAEQAWMNEEYRHSAQQERADAAGADASGAPARAASSSAPAPSAPPAPSSAAPRAATMPSSAVPSAVSSSGAPVAAARAPSTYATARAAALREDADEHELGVITESGELVAELDAGADETAAPTRPADRVILRRQLQARRLVQELGDVRKMPLAELHALEQRAMREPDAVLHEYRAAYEAEVRSVRLEGVKSLREAMDNHPTEIVFVLMSGSRKVVRHTPRDGTGTELLHGATLESVPVAATMFPDLAEVMAKARAKAQAGQSTEAASAAPVSDPPPPSAVPSVPVASVSSNETVSAEASDPHEAASPGATGRFARR